MTLALTISHSIGRRSVLAGAGSVLATSAIVHAQGQANGVALVIGNGKYQWESSLPNVGRDVSDIAKRFQAMGLKTELIQDAGRDVMLAAISRFQTAASGTNLAAFYFAGHGVSWEKQTYIAPVDADLSDPRTVKSLITVPSINFSMRDARNRLLIFDSCRNNPADGWRQREARALARSDADDKVANELSTPNTLALFSTASGAVALDGPPGANSPFAAALLRQLDGPTVDLQALPAKVRRDLLIATECQQLASDRNTYSAPFVLNVTGKPSAPAGARSDASRIVELASAYAYAQQNGLVLPQGLVAYRPAAGGPAARMVGSYKYEEKTGVGAANQNTYLAPALLVVLSVPAANTAEVIVSAKDFGTTGSGARWRFVTATKTENTVSLLSLSEKNKSEFTWRTPDSGQYLGIGQGTIGGHTRRSTFTRLDG